MRFELFTFNREDPPDFYVDILRIGDRSLFSILKVSVSISEIGGTKMVKIGNKVEIDIFWVHLEKSIYIT